MTSEVVVAHGTKHWRAEFAPKFVATNLDGAVFVVLYKRADGRIGFDLDESGELIFREIIGEGRSCSKTGLTGFSNGSATQYVRSLFTPGQQQPITVTGDRARGAVNLHEVAALIRQLASLDVDEQSTRFAAGIAELAESFDCVCVHSIAQWETTIVTTKGSNTLKSLREVCGQNGISFCAVSGEDELPAW